MSLRYAVVTPARNEEANLERLGAAMIAQLHLPVVWVVVDDGSTDATPSVLHRLARSHPWITALERTGADREESLADGRRKARDLYGFLLGAAPLRAEVDVIVKVDADIDFGPDYFEQLIGRFEADPLLGIASGTCWEQEHGAWVRRARPESTVWGASRAYRSDCIADLMALEPRMGWDGLDEVSVQLRGLRTKTFVDLAFRHHRPEGGRELTALHQGEALGATAWYMGYRPLTWPCGPSTARAGNRPRSRCSGATSTTPPGAFRSARTTTSWVPCGSASDSVRRCGGVRRARSPQGV